LNSLGRVTDVAAAEDALAVAEASVLTIFRVGCAQQTTGRSWVQVQDGA
jgi:hypothetical protein